MKTHSRTMPMLYLLLGLSIAGTALTDEEDEAPAAAALNTAQPELTGEQQQAVGITLVHPLPASAASPIQGYGEILDAAALISDSGHLASVRAAARAASAEAQRLGELYKGGADASLRAVESAQAAAVEAQAQAQSAASAYDLQWGPLSRYGDTQRAALIEALASGKSLLLRADLPGRLRIGAVPDKALIDIDGTQVPARVLGPLRRSATDSQSVGLLLLVEQAPNGLGAGARVMVALQGDVAKGVLVPNAALLYGEQGAYVYRRLGTAEKDGKQQYAPVAVKLLQASGDAWLVQGVDADDTIVANGAGVLWSLQGLGTFSAEEEEHD